jgi:hypothetical protein
LANRRNIEAHDKEAAMTKRLLIFLFIASFLVPLTCSARVMRFVVTQTRSFAGGMSFGNVGQYQRLDGTAYFEVDPNDPLNSVIVNLDKAPRNAKGLVEFSSPFFILKPVNMESGNHKIFFGLNNRGNKIEIELRTYLDSVLPAAQLNDPITAQDAGDAFLERLGYTIVDTGWQGDVAPGNNRLFPSFPVATQLDGSPIVADVRIEYSDRTIPAAGTFTRTLEGNANFRSYPTADMNTAHSSLTVRGTVSDTGPMTPIPADQWAFGSCPTGQSSLVANDSNICLFAGFQHDKLYQLIYPAKNPMVMGLAYAVTRDLGSFLRYQAQDDVGNPNPLRLDDEEVGIRRAYGLGSSSTGMYMRDFLYLGFNEDERHRRVFDGVHIHIPGTQRLFANVQFADPNTYSRQDDRHDFLSTSYAPVTFAVTTDPVSGLRDGILKRPATDPVVFQTTTEIEWWQFRASLDVADGFGRPVKIPDNVRLYLISSNQHGGTASAATFPGVSLPPVLCQNPTNPNFQGPSLRALLIALDAWVDQGTSPPPSNYPQLGEDEDGGSLVSREQAEEAFPRIPGVNFPTLLNELEVLDFGADFNSEGGLQTVLPPHLGPSYKIFVPKPDEDGLDIAGIRPMEIRAPLGTNTGWNVRAPGFRGPNLCGLSGSFIPFATTKAERLATGDPRRSLEERYHSHGGYVSAVRHAARELMRERFLLQEDAQRFINAAEASSILK